MGFMGAARVGIPQALDKRAAEKNYWQKNNDYENSKMGLLGS